MDDKKLNNFPVWTRRDFIDSIKTLAGAGLASSALGYLSSCKTDDRSPSQRTRQNIHVPESVRSRGDKPNIIFILTDDHRWDHLRCMGHRFLETPNLDRIAREGALFENAFVTTSLCSPSRASFLTGQYAHTHGVVTNHTPWDNNNTTFLEYLSAAGYDTAFIGKWHMPGDGLPNLRGVDRFVSFTKEGGQGVYNSCPLIIDGVETPRPGKYITEDLTDLSLEFIEHGRENPFCLYLSHKAVHFGFRPPAHLSQRYDDVELNLPPESDTFNTFTRNNMFVGAPLPMNMMYRNYCECIASVDEQVGRILEALERSGELDNTIIVYAGDNGHFWGEHGLYDKRLAYEESIRIPFLVRAPGVIQNPGVRIRDMALNIDLAPTLLDLLDIPVPEPIQGRSLLSKLRGEGGTIRDRFLYEHFPVFPIPIPGITAIRTEQYKYITYQNDVRPRELFDLSNDPREMNNMIDTPEGRPLVSRLAQELEALKRETGYQFHHHG